MAPPPRPQPSTPFVSREFNGEVLLDELADLRNAQLPERHLTDLVVNLRDLGGVRVSEAAQRLKSLAANRFSATPALAALLTRWSSRLKTEADVPLLVSHFERLAIAAAAVGSMRRAAHTLRGPR